MYSQQLKSAKHQQDTLQSTTFCFISYKTAWWQLYQISKIKKFLTTEQLKTVTLSLVLTKLDQNNSLLYNLPDYLLLKLQRVQNSAARLVCSAGQQIDPSVLLISLHWLPIKQRIKFKILLTVYKCLNGRGPAYLSELLSPYTNSKSRHRLRSSEFSHLDVPRSITKFGDRSFCVCGPKLWNALPARIRNSASVSSFRKSLKTFLF